MKNHRKLERALALIDEVLMFYWSNKEIDKQFLALLDSSAIDLEASMTYLEKYEGSNE